MTAVRAVAATEAARTFRMVGESKMWDASDPQEAVSSSTLMGEVDLASQSMHMLSKTKLSDPSESEADEGTIEIIQIQRDAWVKLSPGTVNAVGGAITIEGSDKPWQHSTGRSGLFSGGFDPSTMLDRLRAHGAQLTKRGEDTVRGVSTTHYRISGGDTTSSTIRDVTLKSIAIDVWLDGQDVVRRMEATAEVESKDHSVGRGDNVMDFYDFGAALHIEPPPADLVGEAPVSPGGPSTTTTVFRPGQPGQ